MPSRSATSAVRSLRRHSSGVDKVSLPLVVGAADFPIAIARRGGYTGGSSARSHLRPGLHLRPPPHAEPRPLPGLPGYTTLGGGLECALAGTAGHHSLQIERGPKVGATVGTSDHTCIRGTRWGVPAERTLDQTGNRDAHSSGAVMAQGRRPAAREGLVHLPVDDRPCTGSRLRCIRGSPRESCQQSQFRSQPPRNRIR